MLASSMYPRFDRHCHRLFVNLVVAHRVDGKVRQSRLGSLGSVVWSEPLSVTARIRFWAGFDQRFRALVARHPGRVTLNDRDKVRLVIDQRIPGPRNAEERRLQLIAAIQRDAIAAVQQLDAGEDGMEEAAKQLLRLAREKRRIDTDKTEQAVMTPAPNEKRRP